MTQIRSSVSLSTVFLVYLVAILALTTWAGVLVGVVCALAASGLENYYFVKPFHTLVVARPGEKAHCFADAVRVPSRPE